MIPSIPKSLKRALFINQISRNPKEVAFRGIALIGKLSPASIKWQAEMAGFKNELIAGELMLAIPIGESPPNPPHERVTVGESEYRIVDFTPDDGENCYYLTLAAAE